MATGSVVTEGNLPYVATTGNVDYQVDGDGSVIWNSYNPCGQFRAFQDWNGSCLFFFGGEGQQV